MNINLHIERLVLDGLPVEANDSAMLRAAIEAELTRLLTENGLSSRLQTGGALPRLQANANQLGGAGRPPQLGQQIAQTVYDSIGNEIEKK